MAEKLGPVDSTMSVATIIEGSIQPETIRGAVDAYMVGIGKMAFPPDLKGVLGLSQDIEPLREAFRERAVKAGEETIEIIHQINARAALFRDHSFRQLQTRDESLWASPGQRIPLFGVLACVDKGVPAEAVAGLQVQSVGRVLGGDISIEFIPSRQAFYPKATVLIKRLVHSGRIGASQLVEPLIEHTSCGRRGQILNNERGLSDVPSIGYIFDNVDALDKEFSGEPSTVHHALNTLRTLWASLEKRGSAVVVPDGGVYVGVVQKIAQRQALKQLSPDIAITSPIEVYEKETGNLYAGLDQLAVLTHERVLSSRGYTNEMLNELSNEGLIFSLAHHAGPVFGLLEEQAGVKRGSRTFQDLQTEWFATQSDFVEVTEKLWKLLAENIGPVHNMVEAYFQAWKGQSANLNDIVDRRVIHHLFHVAAYAYTLDTFSRGNPPGVHHIEQYLATGDHEIGAKTFMALGQGDLDKPSAGEMFTGYSVLLHSTPGKEGTPIPVVIKLDTDRTRDLPMSTEETTAALIGFQEMLKLWPYILAGDMIPIVMVRGKQTGGVSRLALSVIRSFEDLAVLYQQQDKPLPDFVPATTTNSEVVLVPAKELVVAAIETTQDLREFRRRCTLTADRFAAREIQSAFAR